MKKLLFIDREQFGSLTDSLKYCEYLHNTYQIVYFCFDKGRPKISFPNMKIIYIPQINPRALRGIVFIFIAIIKCLFFNGKIFILYFPKCEIIKQILFWKKMHIDIRTLSVITDEEKRIKENKQICKSINNFESVSFITQAIANAAHIKTTIKKYILPLGSDIISHTNKDFSILKLLYIGTLENRDIIKTVLGLELFIKKYPTISIIYNIIGDGSDYNLIKNYIIEHKLTHIIKMHGRLPYSALKPFLDSHNTGISFIPITPGYDLQPPTKTYEYILSGLCCLATKTQSNRDVIINDINGYLIDDSPSSFCQGIEHIYTNRNKFQSENIRQTLIPYQWNFLIEKYLKPIIED